LSDQERLSSFAKGEQENTEWKKKTFSEVIEVNNYPSLEKGEKETYVAMGDLNEFERKINSTSKKEYKYSAPRFKNDDTLFPKMSRCLELGKTAYVDVLDDGEIAFGSTEFIVMRPKDNEILSKFIYYTVRREDIRQHAQSWATGSTARRQRISTDLFDELRINLPPIKEQKEIVGFLDAIDTKIETNNHINKLLEEIADNTYKSWFVDFDQYSEFKNSELGKIPVDFEVVEFSAICDTSGGGTPNTENDDYWGGEVEWLTPKEVTTLETPVVYNTERKLSKEGLENTSAKLMPKKSILLASRGTGTVGELGINRVPMSTNQGFICLNPNSDIQSYYLLYTVKNKRPEIENVTGGSTFPELSQRAFNDIALALPPQSEREKFDCLVETLYDKIYENKKENDNLADLRDTLLPELMSGEIRLDPDSNNKQVFNN